MISSEETPATKQQQKKRWHQIRIIKGKYFGQNPLFFPLPSTEIPLFLPCFLVKKKGQM